VGVFESDVETCRVENISSDKIYIEIVEGRSPK
jgi:hypothetical protein